MSCGPKTPEIDALRAQVKETNGQIENAAAFMPWNNVRLKTADTVLKQWRYTQDGLLREFAGMLLATQKRSCGTLGFTLCDEWRYCQYDMDGAFVDKESRYPDEHVIPPQVVAPYDKCWDARVHRMTELRPNGAVVDVNAKVSWGAMMER